jgi:drug/metabolite transporter superfamily protein YnfA
MAKAVMVIIGLAFLLAGGYLCCLWWPDIKIVLLAAVAIVLLLAGIIILTLGISEYIGDRTSKKDTNLLSEKEDA